jgi:hypothetical protein
MSEVRMYAPVKDNTHVIVREKKSIKTIFHAPHIPISLSLSLSLSLSCVFI